MVKVNIPECIDIELITGIVCDMGVFFYASPSAELIINLTDFIITL